MCTATRAHFAKPLLRCQFNSIAETSCQPCYVAVALTQAHSENCCLPCSVAVALRVIGDANSQRISEHRSQFHRLLCSRTSNQSTLPNLTKWRSAP